IEPGCEWPVAISEAIQNIQVMVVIYSNNSATSTQVPKELTLADKRKKKILPYKIDDTELFGSFDYFLSSAHWIMENKENPNESFQELFRVICHSIGINKDSDVVTKPQTANVAQRSINSNNVNTQTNKQPVEKVYPKQGTPKKKKTWLIPVCIGGGVVVFGAFLVLLIGLVVIGSVTGGENKDDLQVQSGINYDSSMEVTPKEEFDYTIDELGVTISKYKGTADEVVVPSEIDNLPVVQIGFNAFSQNPFIQTVYLPNSVQYICPGAFESSSLSTIYLPNGLERIENSVFYNCQQLKRITLPKSLRTIDSWAFAQTGLEEIVLPDSVELIMENSFLRCTSLKSVTFSNNLKSIGTASFAGTALTEVSLPESVSFIGAQAFMECAGLQSVKLPATLFYIPEQCFYKCTDLSHVVFPEQLMKIDAFAFSLTALSKLDLSKLPLMYLGTGAFGECLNLTAVSLPANLCKIDHGCFQYCTALTNIVLPEKIQMVSSSAFFECDSIQVVYGTESFGCDQLEELFVTMNNSLAENYSYSQSENGYCIESYNGQELCAVVPEEINGSPVYSIGENVFANCKDVHMVVLPSTIQSIDYQAFMNCSNLILIAG
ncbi:MAG: leucine-rich repeat protein, partial [Lachnospiraceae bacterium]|nr:leucine-rich repeat protein [Lachnospiraceae bacterium]